MIIVNRPMYYCADCTQYIDHTQFLLMLIDLKLPLIIKQMVVKKIRTFNTITIRKLRK